MLARPATIAAMPRADRLASRTVHDGAAPRIVTRCGLRCERFACGFDRTKAVLAPCLRHTRFAMATVAKAILNGKRLAIPTQHLLCEAQRTMHRNALPLSMRAGQTAQIVHYWADEFNKDLAAEIREHVHPWCERTITDDAARWVQGERIEPPDPATLPPDTPRMVHVQFYSWDGDGRPHEFWS